MGVILVAPGGCTSWLVEIGILDAYKIDSEGDIGEPCDSCGEIQSLRVGTRRLTQNLGLLGRLGVGMMYSPLITAIYGRMKFLGNSVFCEYIQDKWMDLEVRLSREV